LDDDVVSPTPRSYSLVFFVRDLSLHGLWCRAADPGTHGLTCRLNAFELSALERAVMTTKSILLGSRLIMEYTSPEKCGGRRYGVEEISELANLEVRFQTQMWGEVEDSNFPLAWNVSLTVAHDVDYADIRRQLGSAATLLMKRELLPPPPDRKFIPKRPYLKRKPRRDPVK